MKIIFFATGTTALVTRVTPVQKVTELLVKLKQKSIEEGKREKELFGKFDDYCHNQEDEKFWLAAKEAKKADRLDDEIKNLDAQIEKKTRKIEEIAGEIDANNGSIAEQTKKMEDASAADAKALADLDTVISQCKRAVEHLSASDVSGTGFAQLASLLEASLNLRHPPAGLKHVADQIQLIQEPGKPHAFKFHSTVIITLLEKLLTEFKNQRVAKDNEALSARSASEHAIQTVQSLVDSQVHQKDEFQGEVDAHNEERQTKAEDRAQTGKDLFANVDFQHHLVGCDQFANNAEEKGARNLSGYLPKHLKDSGGCPSDIGECGKKRENYAARVKTRAEEVVALSKAIELMQGEGGESYKSNKKLVGLVNVKKAAPSMLQEATQSVEEARDEDMMDESSSTSFLQLSKRHAAERRLVKFLTRETSEFKSTVLSSLLLSVQTETNKKDHFKKIRGIINEMIDKLTKQVESEQKQKDWCDTQLKDTHEQRDAATSDIEQATSTIDTETAIRNKLEEEIGELQKQIAADSTAKKEATELRNDEKADNEQTVADAREGVAAVTEAISVLSEFYSANAGNAFVQENPAKVAEHVEYRAQGEGADGKTIADTRPESDDFDTTYAGNQNESKGIIGILEVIQTDYDRTIDTVTAAEAKAAEDWKTEDERLAGEIEAANAEVKDKTDQKNAAQETITSNEGDLATAKKELAVREEELEALKPLCGAAEAEDQKEERRKRREQEVASLREALDILRDYSF